MTTHPADMPASSPNLLVGIGVSISIEGTEGLLQLFRALPPDLGACFLVVGTQDLGRQSDLHALLESACAMPVISVLQPTPLAANTVYVVSPHHALIVGEGGAEAPALEFDDARDDLIDRLFTSLAFAYGERSVALVLSGLSGDGASGIVQVHEHGGLCLAEMPTSDAHGEMPRRAIATGCVDKVLPLAEMPGLLATHCAQFESTHFAPSGNGDIEAILQELSEGYGLAFQGAYKRGTLARRLNKRMSTLRLNDYGAYLERIRAEPAELHALRRDVLIGVTSFFRDPPVWERLDQKVLPTYFGGRSSRDPVKIWCAGCASGEEAYSLGMVFLEQLGRMRHAPRLHVFGSDVADEALSVARRGHYPRGIEEVVSAERIVRWFVPEDHGFRVKQELRRAVTFAAHDLLSDPPFSGLDFVSCRNVLIYLEPHAQDQILDLFHFALKPGGLLLLGQSGSVARRTNLFETVSKSDHIYRAREVSLQDRRRQLSQFPGRTHARLNSAPQRSSSLQRNGARTLEQVILSRHTFATVVVSEALEIQSFFGPTGEYLTQPTGEARLDLLAWVKPGLYPRLRNALEQAFLTGERVVLDDISLKRDQQNVRVRCTLEPLRPTPGEPRVLVVSFRDVALAHASDDRTEVSAHAPLLHQLETELKVTREELRSTLEQLDIANEDYRASNEELLSLNEELQSNNEELETSREELQSVNDEMVAINQQLEERNLELRHAYADLSNLLESTNIPIIFLDRELNIRRFTPAARMLLPLRPADIGRPFEELRDQFSDADFVSGALSVLRTEQTAVTEVRARNGRWFVQTLSPYRTDDGRVDGVSVAFHDVTDTKAAARRAEEERAFADAIVHTIPSPLLVLTRSLQVLSANRSFYERFGLDASETEGRGFFELSDHAWDLPKMRTLLLRVLPADEEVRDYEVEVVSSSVGRQVLHVNARIMRREGGADLILLLLEDVTALRNAEMFTARRADDLAQEARRKDDFLAMLGHELRNPLSALVHGLDLWKALGEEPERLENVRQMMSRQAQRMRAMLDQLLEVSRLKAGRLTLTFAPVDVAAVLQTALEGAAHVLEHREHQLITDVAIPGPLHVSGDLHRLVQALENVLTNAARFTPVGGNIHVKIRASGAKVRITISDDGIGIEAELLPHLFELFTQGPRALDRAEGGLGLGLPLVKSIIEMHGGTVEIASEGRGQGCEVVLTLPLHQLPVDVGPEDERPAGTAPTARRVLIVDDEADCGQTLAEILSLRGYATVSVRDGAAALAQVATFAPHVVILDIGLPSMNGYELAERLASVARGPTPLLIAVTGYQRDDAQLQAAGIDHHLLKPPELATLLRMLEEFEPPR